MAQSAKLLNLLCVCLSVLCSKSKLIAMKSDLQFIFDSRTTTRKQQPRTSINVRMFSRACWFSFHFEFRWSGGMIRVQIEYYVALVSYMAFLACLERVKRMFLVN